MDRKWFDLVLFQSDFDLITFLLNVLSSPPLLFFFLVKQDHEIKQFFDKTVKVWKKYEWDVFVPNQVVGHLLL